MGFLAHVGATEEITYVFLPAAVFFVVYRLVRGKVEPSEPRDRAGSGRRA
jgi:hypothetical protein